MRYAKQGLRLRLGALAFALVAFGLQSAPRPAYGQ